MDKIEELENLIMTRAEESYRKNMALYQAGDEKTVAGVNQMVLKLQNGDPEIRRMWRILRSIGIKKANEVYRMLGVRFDG